jgi:hypothetical protein
MAENSLARNNDKHVPWSIVTRWCQADLEDIGASKDEVFILVGHAQMVLDNR